MPGSAIVNYEASFVISVTQEASPRASFVLCEEILVIVAHQWNVSARNARKCLLSSVSLSPENIVLPVRSVGSALLLLEHSQVTDESKRCPQNLSPWWALHLVFLCSVASHLLRSSHQRLTATYFDHILARLTRCLGPSLSTCSTLA